MSFTLEIGTATKQKYSLLVLIKYLGNSKITGINVLIEVIYADLKER
jgi:hypothetical protein